MLVFITGGTGFVGRHAARHFLSLGHEVMVLSRSGGQAPEGTSLVAGDPTAPGAWQDAAARADIVVNLAGASISSRWTAAHKQEMLRSRVLSTRNVVSALARRANRDAVLLSASAVGYYGAQANGPVFCEEHPPGSDFLAEVGRLWEAEARKAEETGARVCRMRFGIVLGRGGGALKTMLPAFRARIASPFGTGRQWFSWVHIGDLVRIMAYLAERRDIGGAVNCTAPKAVTNAEFTATLAEVLGARLFMPRVPALALRLLMGELGDMLTKGQRVVPRRLLAEGFRFSFPEVRGALQDILGRRA